MKSTKSDSFWPSYTDLMTSLFFVMLVLFVLVFTKQHNQIKDLKRKLAIIDAVEQNLKPLKEEKSLFTYEEKFKRFKLSFEVKFLKDKSNLTEDELEDFFTTIVNIDKAGRKLKSIIDTLSYEKNNNPKLLNVSYIMIISGYASRTGDEKYNYALSYQRALSLKNYWSTKGIDFESPKYMELIDLHIAGNGWGGIGRLANEPDNQRFLIQLFPKIGDIK